MKVKFKKDWVLSFLAALFGTALGGYFSTVTINMNQEATDVCVAKVLEKVRNELKK
jgi:hypothetical protein